MASQDTFTNHDVYVQMSQQQQKPIAAASSDPKDFTTCNSKPIITDLTPQEIAKLRTILNAYGNGHDLLHDGEGDDDDVRSDYPEFPESTHSWAIFADNPTKKMDRIVGTIIIAFQLFTYWLFAAEAIEDYQRGAVEVLTTHEYCLASNQAPEGNFQCEAEYTSNADAFVAFFMLGIFLASDVQQAARAIRKAHSKTALCFAILAAVEIVAAFVAAAISISQKLYIGEVTDAVEVGVGLLFIRELSTRAYHGIRHRNRPKQYKSFFLVLAIIVTAGMLVDPICEALFAP